VYETTDTIIDDDADGLAYNVYDVRFRDDQIIAFAEGSFTVDDNSDNSHPNTSGQVYNYMVLGTH